MRTANSCAHSGGSTAYKGYWECLYVQRTGRVSRHNLVVLLQGDVASLDKDFSFRFQSRAHRTPHDLLGFFQGHVVVAQPELGTQGVEFIRFRHGQSCVCVCVVVCCACFFRILVFVCMRGAVATSAAARRSKLGRSQ